jgi:hypothetical protein
MELVKSVQEVSYHRNGVCGNGFYAVRFTSDIEADDGNWGSPEAPARPGANFLAIVFDEPGSCAVICLDLIESVGVKFAGGNSWRGDQYEPELRKAIKTTASSGSVRVGPFAIPIE